MNFRKVVTSDNKCYPSFLAGKWVDPNDSSKTQLHMNISGEGRNTLYITSSKMEYYLYDASGGEIGHRELGWGLNEAWYQMINWSTGGQPYLMNGITNCGGTDESVLLIASTDQNWVHQSNFSVNQNGLKFLYKLNGTDQTIRELNWARLENRFIRLIDGVTSSAKFDFNQWGNSTAAKYAWDTVTMDSASLSLSSNAYNTSDLGTYVLERGYFNVQKFYKNTGDFTAYRVYNPSNSTWSAWHKIVYDELARKVIVAATTTSWESMMNTNYGSSYKWLGKCADYVGSTIASQTANQTVTNHFVGSSITGGADCGATLTLVTSAYMSIFVQACNGWAAIFSLNGNGRYVKLLCDNY